MFLIYISEWWGKHHHMPADWDASDGRQPFIALYAADRKLIPWNPSQADMQTDDWGLAD